MFDLNLFKTARPVMFARDPASEALPTPEPYEKVESLREAWETLQAALAECEKRLKKILDAYKSEKDIPKDLLPTYKEYKKERDDIKAEIKNLEKREGFNADEAWTDVDEATQDLVTNTLTELDGAYAAYAKIERISWSDTMNSRLTPPVFAESAETRHVKGRVKTEKKDESAVLSAAPEAKEEKRARAKESPEYWEALYKDIAGKIINKARTGTEDSLTVEERTAVMFMKGGETRTVMLEGQKFLLERDIPGKFLRLRNYWLENGKDEEEKAKEDPYIASSGARDATPVWKTVTSADLSAREKRRREGAEAKEKEAREKNYETAKEDLSEEINRIFSEETPAGTVLHFTDAAAFGPATENGRKGEFRTQIELKKRYGGSVEARFLKQEVDILNNGTEGPPQTSDETVIYRDSQMEACREKIVPDAEPSLQFAMIDPTPEESEAERMAYIDRQLDWMSGNLVRSTALPRGNTEFIAWTGHIQKLIDRENFKGVWEQEPVKGFLDRHVRVEDGKISILERNKEYIEYRNRRNNRGEQPPEYLAYEEDIRLNEDQLPPDLPENLRLV